MTRFFIFVIIATCIVPLAIGQWPPQQQYRQPPNQGQQSGRSASDQRSPPGDNRGRPSGGGGMMPPPNPNQRQDRPPQQMPGNQFPGQVNRMGPPPPPKTSMGENNPQVQAVATFLRTDEGQKDLATAVDKEASVIAQEMIEVLQEDAAREDQIGTIDNGSAVVSSCFNALYFVLAIFTTYRSI